MNQDYEKDKKSNPDHVATPRCVVESVYEEVHIEDFDNIWFPFNNYDSEFKLKADELNLKYKATHVFDDLGNNFFTTEPPKGCDLMISNPPFSLQNQIINRSFSLIDDGKIKSFALLLPLATLATVPRASVYKQYTDKLSIGFIENRIKFKGHKQVFPKDCCWICYAIPALKDTPYFWVYIDDPTIKAKKTKQQMHVRRVKVENRYLHHK